MNASGRTNEELAVLAQQGDREAADELVRGNEALVRTIANRCTSPVFRAMSHAEKMASGSVGLWTACHRFDASKGVKFSTYAWRAIVWHILRDAKDEGQFIAPHSLKRGQNRTQKQLSVVDRENNSLPSDTLEPWEILADAEDDAVNASRQADSLESLRDRNPQASRVLSMRMQGMPLREIGKEMGFSFQRAQQILADASEQLRRAG